MSLSERYKVECDTCLLNEIEKIVFLAWHEVDWNLLLRKYGLAYLLEKVHRLDISQVCESYEYPQKVRELFVLLYKEDTSRAKSILKEIINVLQKMKIDIQQFPHVQKLLEI